MIKFNVFSTLSFRSLCHIHYNIFIRKCFNLKKYQIVSSTQTPQKFLSNWIIFQIFDVLISGLSFPGNALASFTWARLGQLKGEADSYFLCMGERKWKLPQSLFCPCATDISNQEPRVGGKTVDSRARVTMNFNQILKIRFTDYHSQIEPNHWWMSPH